MVASAATPVIIHVLVITWRNCEAAQKFTPPVNMEVSGILSPARIIESYYSIAVVYAGFEHGAQFQRENHKEEVLRAFSLV